MSNDVSELKKVTARLNSACWLEPRSNWKRNPEQLTEGQTAAFVSKRSRLIETAESRQVFLLKTHYRDQLLPFPRWNGLLDAPLQVSAIRDEGMKHSPSLCHSTQQQGDI